MSQQKVARATRRSRGVSTWVVALTVVVGGCGEGDGRQPATDPAGRAEAHAPFEGATGTLDGLGRRVLSALVDGDTAELGGFRLTEREHNEVVWPELPASRPEVGFPLDFAWKNIELRDRRSIHRLLPMFADLELTYGTVQCRGDTREYATFRVLTDCWTLFEVEGREGLFEAQLFKDVLVRGGGHKVFRYYDERPRPYLPAGVD
ncbi:MAG: hypothetical protein U5R14_13080 [Gemmatimonadota bacterium]|nr:hypothetical protein [Gemmatimonadota bacterium]